MDKRNRPRRRRIIIELVDQTNIPFESADMENFGEQVQEILEKDFDVSVDKVYVEVFNDYQNDWIQD